MGVYGGRSLKGCLSPVKSCF